MKSRLSIATTKDPLPCAPWSISGRRTDARPSLSTVVRHSPKSNPSNPTRTINHEKHKHCVPAAENELQPHAGASRTIMLHLNQPTRTNTPQPTERLRGAPCPCNSINAHSRALATHKQPECPNLVRTSRILHQGNDSNTPTKTTIDHAPSKKS
jgi:hypothetical protein